MEAVESKLRRDESLKKINDISVVIEEPALLSTKAMAKYLSIGVVFARNLLSQPDCPYVVKLGERRYANKKVLDKWIAQNTGK